MNHQQILKQAYARFEKRQGEIGGNYLCLVMETADDDAFEALVALYRKGDTEGMGALLQDMIDLSLWEDALMAEWNQQTTNQ